MRTQNPHPLPRINSPLDLGSRARHNFSYLKIWQTPPLKAKEGDGYAVPFPF